MALADPLGDAAHVAQAGIDRGQVGATRPTSSTVSQAAQNVTTGSSSCSAMLPQLRRRCRGARPAARASRARVPRPQHRGVRRRVRLGQAHRLSLSRRRSSIGAANVSSSASSDEQPRAAQRVGAGAEIERGAQLELHAVLVDLSRRALEAAGVRQRRRGEPLTVAQLAVRAPRPRAASPGRRRSAAAALRLAELGQQIAHEPGVGVDVAAVQSERRARTSARPPRGPALRARAARPAGSARSPRRRRPPPSSGRRARPEACPGRSSSSERDPAVQPRAPRRAELHRQRVGDECVLEAVAAEDVLLLAHEPRPPGVVERVQQLVRRAAEHLRRAGRDRSRCRSRPRRGAGPRWTSPSRCTRSVITSRTLSGTARAAVPAREPPTRRVVLQRAALDVVAEQLAEEERVAARLAREFLRERDLGLLNSRPVRSCTSATTSAASSPRTAIRSTPDSRCSCGERLAQRAAATSESRSRGRSTTTSPLPPLETTWRSRLSVGRSAHWRSSRTTSSGCSPAAACRSPATASNSRYCSISGRACLRVRELRDAARERGREAGELPRRTSRDMGLEHRVRRGLDALPREPRSTAGRGSRGARRNGRRGRRPRRRGRAPRCAWPAASCRSPARRRRARAWTSDRPPPTPARGARTPPGGR